MQTTLNAFLKDLKGIFIKPGITLGKMMDQKKWVGSFILILLVIGICSYITLPYEMAQSAEILQDSKFADYLEYDPADSSRPISSLRRAFLSSGTVFLLALSLAVAAFFIYLFYGIGGAEGLYVNYFSLAVNASIIHTLIPGLLSTVSMPLGLDITATTNAAVFFPSLPGKSFLALLLSQLELFSIWYIVVIAAGIAVFAKITFKKSLTIAIFYFCFRSLILVLFSYLALQLSGM